MTRQRISQHDREIAAIRKLVLQGMKMLVENEAQIEKMSATVDRFVRSLESGGSNDQSKTDLR